MGEKSQIMDLNQFFTDVLKGISSLSKKVEELNNNINSSKTGETETVLQKLDQIENYFHSMKETTELLSELLAELRILVPVLHLNKLIDETKSILLSSKTGLVTESTGARIREGDFKSPVSSKTVGRSSPSTSKEESPFSPPPVEPVSDESAKQTSDKKESEVVYSSRVPSYIKEKKKPKSIWAGIRDEEEEPQP